MKIIESEKSKQLKVINKIIEDFNLQDKAHHLSFDEEEGIYYLQEKKPFFTRRTLEINVDTDTDIGHAVNVEEKSDIDGFEEAIKLFEKLIGAEITVRVGGDCDETRY